MVPKAMEAIEKNPKAQDCSQITKFELATYLLMKQHEFDEDSVACCENDESFDDTKQFTKGQLISKCPYEKSVSSKIPTKLFLS